MIYYDLVSYSLLMISGIVFMTGATRQKAKWWFPVSMNLIGMLLCIAAGYFTMAARDHAARTNETIDGFSGRHYRLVEVKEEK